MPAGPALARPGEEWVLINGIGYYCEVDGQALSESLAPDVATCGKNEIMTAPTSPRLSAHLRHLEAESIGIIREAAAVFRNPVMLYSIGKDSCTRRRQTPSLKRPGCPDSPE
jgi:hypothetical protein